MIGRVVKTACGHSRYISVAKYAIIQMLTANIGRDAIMRITGHGDSVINDCMSSLMSNEVYLHKDKVFVEDRFTKHDLMELL